MEGSYAGPGSPCSKQPLRWPVVHSPGWAQGKKVAVAPGCPLEKSGQHTQWGDLVLEGGQPSIHQAGNGTDWQVGVD